MSQLTLTLEHFQQGPMTGSSAEGLVQIFAGPDTSVAEFARQLPPGAHFYDVAAGLSDLSNKIGEANPEALVTAIDIQYGTRDPNKRAQIEALQAAAPPNVTYLALDALHLPSDLPRARIVASYNFVSHLNRFSRALGRQALSELLGLLDPNEGVLYVGPTNAHMTSSKRWGAQTLQAGASQQEIEDVDRSLRSPVWAMPYYAGATASGVSLYQGGRFSSSSQVKGLVVSDNAGQTCHNLVTSRGTSWEGILLAGKLGLAVVREAATLALPQQHRTNT